MVTGTLTAGTIRAGDELLALPSQHVLRVRGLQALRMRRTEVTAAARVAVNLRGADPREVRRGCALVTPAAGSPRTRRTSGAAGLPGRKDLPFASRARPPSGHP